ncbi:MAG: hypothetical protein A3E78_02505 [Alphaproteobacteria bacterium RIFCSPHIGHO2_12_FULL_63_12]|nr:MAG: hypothetical protein A3E78_02505 [Alphaproteobacteria bacterium RIFCSPHIGHO2_12_FULL_63_12]
MSTISKNQRSGPKQKAQPRVCSEGHVITPVQYVPVFGRRVMMDQCACGIRLRPWFKKGQR